MLTTTRCFTLSRIPFLLFNTTMCQTQHRVVCPLFSLPFRLAKNKRCPYAYQIDSQTVAKPNQYTNYKSTSDTQSNNADFVKPLNNLILTTIVSVTLNDRERNRTWSTHAYPYYELHHSLPVPLASLQHM